MTRSGKSRPRPTLREAAVGVLRTLLEAGHEAYFAGGCVRDRLMGIEPVDYDVATDARPEEVASLYPAARRVGESFGVMLINIRGHQIEVATFRTDGVYSDGRHPDEVTFSDADHDAKRRDFTINGLFENPITGEVIDYVGGRADLEAKVIRAIGDPGARLHEDRLRTLRAVRFAARFGFEIDPDTAQAIRAAADELPGVSRERIGQEVKKMLGHLSRARAAREIERLGLDRPVLEETTQQAELVRLGGLPPASSYPTALCAWLLDRHEKAGAWLEGGDLDTRARAWSAALLMSNAEQDDFRGCLRSYGIVRGSWPDLEVAGQKRLAAQPAMAEALQVLHGFDPRGRDTVARRVDELAGMGGLAPTPLIDGDDLIGLGLEPGPLFSRVLDAVYDAQLEGRLANREAALALARSVAGGGDLAP